MAFMLCYVGPYRSLVLLGPVGSLLGPYVSLCRPYRVLSSCYVGPLGLLGALCGAPCALCGWWWFVDDDDDHHQRVCSYASLSLSLSAAAAFPKGLLLSRLQDAVL